MFPGPERFDGAPLASYTSEAEACLGSMIARAAAASCSSASAPTAAEEEETSSGNQACATGTVEAKAPSFQALCEPSFEPATESAAEDGADDRRRDWGRGCSGESAPRGRRLGRAFRYDPGALAEALSGEIPWEGLCRDHDGRIRSCRRDAAAASARKKPLDDSEGDRDQDCDAGAALDERSSDARATACGGGCHHHDDDGSSVTTPLQVVLSCLRWDRPLLPACCAPSLVRTCLRLVVFLRLDDGGGGAEGRRQQPSPGGSQDGATLATRSAWSRSRRELVRSAEGWCRRAPGLSLSGPVVEMLERLLLSFTESDASPMAPRIDELERIVSLVLACFVGGPGDENALLRVRDAARGGILTPPRPDAAALRAAVLALALVDRAEGAGRQGAAPAEPVVLKQGAKDPPPARRDPAGAGRRRAGTAGGAPLLWRDELSDGESDRDGSYDDLRPQRFRSGSEGGEESDRDLGTATKLRVRRPPRSWSEKMISPMGLDSTSRPSDGGVGRGQLKRRMKSLRTQLLSTFFEHLLPARHPRLPPDSDRSDAVAEVLHVLLVPELAQTPESSSLRLLMLLCAALVLRCREGSLERVVESLLGDLWGRIPIPLEGPLRCRSSGAGLLHCYAEVVGECAWFDDPRLLSIALGPLLRAVLEGIAAAPTSDRHSSEGNDRQGSAFFDADAENDSEVASTRSESLLRSTHPPHGPQEKPWHDPLPYRCALAYVLSRRGTCAIVRSLEHLKLPGFGSGAEAWTHLALRCGRWSDWFHEAWRDDRAGIRLSLQAAGILSICDSSKVAPSSARASSSRSRRYTCRMRSEAMRYCKSVEAVRNLVLDDSRPLFSNGSRDKGSKKSSLPKPGSAPGQSPAFVGHLGDDVVRRVLGFLGYKRLLRARGVCRGWRDAADDPRLWRRAYAARFGAPRGAGPARGLGPPSSSESTPGREWKRLFADKLAAERALRFRRHSSGWKARTCRHLGCLQALTTPGQAERHEKKHRRLSAAGSAPTAPKRKAGPAGAKAARPSSSKRPKRETRTQT
jgi:hypothetical protein